MADDVKIQIGQFIRFRTLHPDTSNDIFTDGHNFPKPGKDFLEFGVDPEKDGIRLTNVAPREPSQDPGIPDQTPLQPAPGTTPMRVSPAQPSQFPGIPRDIPFEPAPPLTTIAPIPFQPAPPIVPTVVSPPQPSLPTNPFYPMHPTPSQDPGVMPETPTSSPPGVTPMPPLDRQFAGGFGQHFHNPQDRLDQIDGVVADFLRQVDGPDGHFSFSGGGPGTQAWNPDLYAKQLVRIGTQLSAAKLAEFGALQTGLFALNWHGRIWNPLTVAPVPGTELFVPAAIDVMTGGSSPNDLLPGGLGGEKFYENNEKFVDRHLALAKGIREEVLALPYPPFAATVVNGGSTGPQGLATIGARLIGAASQDSALVDNPYYGPHIPGTPLLQAGMEERNIHNPDIVYSENPEVTIGGLVDSILDGQGSDSDLLEKDQATGLNRVRISRLFSRTPVTLMSQTPIEYRPTPNLAETRGLRDVDPLRKSAFTDGVVPAGFKNEQKGFIQRGSNQDPSSIVDDDEAYVPMSFTDIRPYGAGKVRTVYFRPFITNLGESFTPEWIRSSGFGRTDPVVGYAGTGRQISLGFIVHAFAPEDLQVIYQKLTWLTSMVYPEYDKDLAFKSGPVVRLRIGDLISSTNVGGLAGVIDQLDFEYSEQVWELKKGNKVPMGYRVSLGFTVLHDTPIGRGNDGKFGGLGTIDQNGIFQPPQVVRSRADSTKEGPEVLGPGDFRAYVDDIDDYDPTA
jgi:hypothetical protein